jgi:hypothetical protein
VLGVAPRAEGADRQRDPGGRACTGCLRVREGMEVAQSSAMNIHLGRALIIVGIFAGIFVGIFGAASCAVSESETL